MPEKPDKKRGIPVFTSEKNIDQLKSRAEKEHLPLSEYVHRELGLPPPAKRGRPANNPAELKYGR